MNWSGLCCEEAILSTSDPPESLSPMNYSATLKLFLKSLSCAVRDGRFLLGRMRGTLTGIETPAKIKFFILVVTLL